MIPQVLNHDQSCNYRLPRQLVLKVAWSALTLHPRSVAHDAQAAMVGVDSGLDVTGAHHIPERGPGLVVCNHYSRPGFDAWWIALGISAAVAAHRAPDADPEIHWVMTAAWTFPESRWRHRVLTPLTCWAFDRLARTYGFVTMPPMPPHPDEVAARALAIRQTLRLARRLAREGGMIGLAPEGRDVSGEASGGPPAGAGTFIALLVRAGLPVLPVGVMERGGRLRVSFGPAFVPQIPHDRAGRDAAVTQQVMAAIEDQLA
jgi:1-acyl-sn-glycerol-3-phosphate acyltransferase